MTEARRSCPWLLVACACTSEVGAPITPEVGDFDEGPCAEVVAGEVLADVPGVTAIGAVLADDVPGHAEVQGWVSTVEGEDPTLVVRRLPAPDEEDFGPIVLGPGSSDQLDRITLVPGEMPGVAYLLREAPPSAFTYRLEAGEGVTATNPHLGNFPAVAGHGPGEFTRHLLMLNHRLHVLAVRKHPGDDALSFELGEFGDGLAVDHAWTLTFGEACDPEVYPECETLDTELRVGGTSFFAENEVAAILIERTIHFVPGPSDDPSTATDTTDLLLLRLRMDSAGPSALLLTMPSAFTDTHPTEDTVRIDPLDTAQDAWGVAMWAVNYVYQDDRHLLYFNAIEDTLWFFVPPETFGVEARLVQLDVPALVDLDDDGLNAAPLGEEPVLVHEIDDALSVETAGRRHVLIRRQDAGPRLLRFGCEN